MPDYGHEIEFGYFLIPDAGDPEGVLETARLADRLGYDLLAVQDHPYQPAHLDSLALLGVILARTERIRVFQDVGNLPLRPPAVFAKAAATLDLLSGGRFEAGLGAGGFLQAAEAMGAPALTPGRASRRWRRPSRSCARAGTPTGAALRRAPLPAPGCAPRPRAGAPDRHLAGRREAARARAHRSRRRRLGRPADELHASSLCGRGAGRHRPRRAQGRPRPLRDPAHLQRARRVHRGRARAGGDTDEAILGPPEHWAEVLTHFALDLGFSTLPLIAPPGPDTLRTFIEDVAPQVRERVATERARSQTSTTTTDQRSHTE